MHGGTVVGRARRRVGLSQAELAHRLGTTRSAVCRWEKGGADPAFGNVVRAVRACGLELVDVLRGPEPDPHDLSLLETSLRQSTSERLQRLIDFAAFVEAGRR